MARQVTRAAIEKAEEKNKAAAKKRDGSRCRLPFCPWCQAFKQQLLHGAHVIAAKGAGGDPALDVSQRHHLMALCALSHASQEPHEWGVTPLTAALTDGPCEFYIARDVYDTETQRYRTEHVLWAREIAIGKLDSAAPYTTWDPLRRQKVQD